MSLNSKLKTLNPKQTQNSKLKIQNIFVLNFGFKILDLFRILSLGFRVFICWLLVISSAYALSLKDAQRDYLAGNYEEAIDKAKRLRENDETLYFLGLAYLNNADYEQARSYLNKLIQKFPKSSFYDLALFKLGDIYFLEKDYEKAQGIYRQLEAGYPKIANKSLLYLRLAQIAGRQGDWETKNKYIQLIKEKYSGGPEMKFVQILESYGDFFTVQAGAFTERKNALSLSEELTAKGYDSSIVEDVQGAYPVYKVRIGRYKSRYEAKRIADQLLDNGYPAQIYP